MWQAHKKIHDMAYLNNKRKLNSLIKWNENDGFFELIDGKQGKLITRGSAAYQVC